MSVIKKKTYLKGLGDLYVKVQEVDDPSLNLDNGEDLALWSAVGGTTVAQSQAKVKDGNYSIAVTGVNADNDGAEWNPTAGTYDLSDYEDKLFSIWIYPTVSGVITVTFQEGADNEEFEYNVTGGEWNKVVLDLSDPSSVTGTPDWALIDGITVTVAGSADDFYIDDLNFYLELAQLERTQNVRIACLDSLAIAQDEDEAELRCSDNELELTEVVATNITVSATVKDFDPEGMAVAGGGEVTTDSVTKQLAETFTVPAGATPQYTLLDAANLKVGPGYGLWLVNAETGEMLQETPDATIIPAKYYYLDPVTGQITFNSNESGLSVTAYYNVITSGRTLEIKTDRTRLEYSIQFQLRGANSKKALVVIPRMQSNTFSINPEKEDFGNYEFEGRLLKPETGDSWYEVHVIEE